MGYAYGYGKGAARRRRSAMVLDAATEAYLAAIAAAGGAEPDADHKRHYDALVRALKDAGLWAKLDLIYLLANVHPTAARTGLRNPGLGALNPTGAPVFTADRGYKSDDLNFLTGPALTGLSQFTLNASSMAARSRETVDPKIGPFFDIDTTGSVNSSLRGANASGVIVCRPNSITTIGSTPVASTIGFYGWSRTAADACFEHKDGIVLTTSAVASESVGAGALQIGRDTRQMASIFIGGALSQSDMQALHAADLAYAQAVGAG